MMGQVDRYRRALEALMAAHPMTQQGHWAANNGQVNNVPAGGGGGLERQVPLAASDGDQALLTGAPTDPRTAPPPQNPPQPTGMAGTTNPGLALLQNYLKWHKRTGRNDPLQALIGKRRESLGGTQGADPVSLLSQGGQPFQQITSGANAGQTAQAYDLGDGRKAHVYYDENGKRSVKVFRA